MWPAAISSGQPEFTSSFEEFGLILHVDNFILKNLAGHHVNTIGLLTVYLGVWPFAGSQW